MENNKLYELLEQLEEFEVLYSKMKQEGTDYFFRHYSDFEEINDSEFHRLRNQYNDASLAIEEYISDKIQELARQIEEFEDKNQF